MGSTILRLIGSERLKHLTVAAPCRKAEVGATAPEWDRSEPAQRESGETDMSGGIARAPEGAA